KWNTQINLDRHALQLPSTWKTGKVVFVNSMSDLFHDDVPLAFIQEVFDRMIGTSQHTYQVLTKRAERLERLSPNLPWAQNIWMGVSVESHDYLWRVNHLRRTQAAIKFLSLEPLLGPLDSIDLRGIDWVIVGGESGPNARPMAAEWVRSIRYQCNRE